MVPSYCYSIVEHREGRGGQGVPGLGGTGAGAERARGTRGAFPRAVQLRAGGQRCLRPVRVAPFKSLRLVGTPF